MKVAVSIPDAVFAEAEVLAKRMKTSRSDVYSRALHEFLGRHMAERVTEQMNRALDEAGSGTSPFSTRAARNVLENTEW